MNLTFEQIRKYFEARLSRSIPPREKLAVLCPFHDDKAPSATVFLSGNGGFNCAGCGAKGNTFQFEMRISGCDLDTARKNIAELTGASFADGGKGRCTAVYDYRKVDGSVVYQKRRYEAPDGTKTFLIYRPDGKRGWLSGLAEDTPRVLFSLPQVVTANLVFLPEGEKDCETLSGLNLWPERPDLRIAATTNFEGAWKPGQAAKWLEQYNSFFSGKQVIVFEDNDESGKAWADHVSASILPFAEGVRRVAFPDLPVKGDVTDWMQTHTAEDLAKLLVSIPKWAPSQESKSNIRQIFVDFPEFASATPTKIDWMVQGIIERGANGFIAAAPKGAKSFTSMDLALSLATASPWLDFNVPIPVKVGVVSREDNPNLTAWRLKHLMQGKDLNLVQTHMLETNLYVNTRRQTPTLMLDNPEEMNELIAAIKRLQLEFVILDVFNVLHAADENDNTEMRVVLNHCKRIQTETGASIGIIHHYNKETQGSITQRLRGASSISGFAEWMIGITMVDEETKTRKMEFELKAACPPDPIHFCIIAPEGEPARIKRVSPMNEPPKTARARTPKAVN